MKQKKTRHSTTILRTAVTFACALAWMGPITVTTTAQQTKEVILAPEQSKKVDVPDGVRKVTNLSESIIKATPDPDGRSVLIKGLKQGRGKVEIARLTREDLVVSVVVEPALKDLADEVQALLSDVEGLRVSVVGERIILDGELLTRADKQRVEGAVMAFQEGRVTDNTRLDTTGHDAAVKRALEKEFGIDTIEVEVDGDRVLILGTVPTREDLERITKLAKRRLDNVTILLQVRR